MDRAILTCVPALWRREPSFALVPSWPLGASTPFFSSLIRCPGNTSTPCLLRLTPTLSSRVRNCDFNNQKKKKKKKGKKELETILAPANFFPWLAGILLEYYWTTVC
jgi:hypothetical protein